MSGKKSNIALLTEGASYIQRAKKARQDQVAEIKFDDEARRDWLTGFSKRKKAKTDDRRQRAKERDHQAHLDERRKARQELKERAIENEKSVRMALGLEKLEREDGDSDDDDDDEDDQPKAGPSTQEFSDDEQMATVTIEEDYVPTMPRVTRYRSTSADGDEGDAAAEEAEAAKSKRAVPLMPASSKRAKDKAKAAKKKDDITKNRSMETKAERKKGRALELTRRMGKAGRAMERDGKQRGVKGGRGRGGKAGGGGRGGKSDRGKR